MSQGIMTLRCPRSTACNLVALLWSRLVWWWLSYFARSLHIQDMSESTHQNLSALEQIESHHQHRRCNELHRQCNMSQGLRQIWSKEIPFLHGPVRRRKAG